MNRPTPIPSLLDARPSARPFSIEGRGRALLLIHGFTGTPGELKPVADALIAADPDWAIEAPLLPGHGTDVGDLSRARASDWTACVERSFLALRARHERVNVCGLSMGGLLAMHLMAKYPDDIARAVLLAPVVAIRSPAQAALRALRLLPWLPNLRIAKKGPRLPDHVAYDAYPLRGLRQLSRLQARVQGELADCGIPTLVAYSEADEVVDPRTVERLKNAWTKDRLRELHLRSSGHILTMDCEGPTVLAAAVAHLSA